MSFPFNKLIQEANTQNKSPEFIKEIVLYAKKLDERDYPVIFSLEHLAILMGMQSYYLRYLTDKNDDPFVEDDNRLSRYQYFKLKKKRGGFREIMAPFKDLKYIQKWILRNILENYPLNEYCKGFRKGISIRDNAVPHEGSEFILKVDLLNFYDTIDERRVYGVFQKMGYAKNLAVYLAKLTTAQHRDQYWKSLNGSCNHSFENYYKSKPSVLPQGAPTSPMLANIVASRLDLRLGGLANELNFRYSRYADDLTFSIKKGGRLPPIDVVRYIVEDEGFFINEKKIKYLPKGGKQYVTGLTTTNGINVSKKYRKKIGAHIYYCRKLGVLEHLKNKSNDPLVPASPLAFHDWLFGHLCFISSINREAGKKLLYEFNKIDWFI